jgi:carbonic anhydrase
MNSILHGVAEFHRDHDDIQPLMEQLARDGQQPKMLLLTCVDSRLDPAMFTRSKPGDILVHRNVGSVVPRPDVGDGSLGAVIEFALSALKIPNIVVMGHSHCGAMEAAVKHNTYGPLSRWLSHVEPAYQRFLTGERLKDGELRDGDQLSQINVLQSIEHLALYTMVAERLETNQVKLHGWWFDLPTCNVSAYDSRQHKFVSVEEVYADELMESREL